jgi:hypothetical protein
VPGDAPKCVSAHLRVSADENRAAQVRELVAFFEVARENQFAEIWITHDPFPAMCALVNGGSAWLMYLRHDGDPGFSSRNPAFVGPPAQKIAYMLGNGQLDRYPASWAYPTEKVFDALTVFARERRVPDWIEWFNDSGDGANGPNAGLGPK